MPFNPSAVTRSSAPSGPSNPFWRSRRVPAGTRGTAGRPHTTGNMGSDNVRWKGPGHYWRGFPCTNPRNCQYNPGGAGTLNNPYYTRPEVHHAGGLTRGGWNAASRTQGRDIRVTDRPKAQSGFNSRRKKKK